MSKIRLIERDTTKPKKDDPSRMAYRYKWEVQAPAKLFGKRIRQYFKTKEQANDYRLELENKLQNSRLAPLDEAVHLCAYRFQKTLTVDQMEVALSNAVEHFSQSNKPLKDFADGYLAELKKSFDRGIIGQTHLKGQKHRAAKVVTWLGNPKIRDISKEMIEDFVDDRLDAGLKGTTIRTYAGCLSTILHRAVDSGVINRHPMKNVKLPKANAEVCILTPGQLQALLNKARTSMDDRGPWFALTNTELQKLVWCKPVTEVAEEMGVSDVAVSKRCRKVGIKTPTPGFWNKVRAGKLPHPEGKHEGNGHVIDAVLLSKNDPANIPAIMIPRLMFGAFAGLRSSEIQRLTWEDVKLELGQLYVSPGKTKNAERWVVLTPPLLDWCEKLLAAGATGLVLQGASEDVINGLQQKLCEAAGVAIPQNALRHSYGSHHLVHYDNAGNTATEMGHYSAQMTFAAYRRAVTKVQAKDYWDIRVEV